MRCIPMRIERLPRSTCETSAKGRLNGRVQGQAGSPRRGFFAFADPFCQELFLRASRSFQGNAFVAAGLNGHGDEFSEGDAGEDEESAGCAAAAEAFAEEKEGGEPGEDGFESEDESGVGGGKKLLGPRLDSEGGCSGEDSGDDQSDHEAGRPVDPGMFEQRHAGGHECGAEADLENRELFKGNARGEAGEGEDVEGESEGAAEGKEVAGADGAEVKGEAETGAGVGRGGEQDDAGEGDCGSEPGVPSGSADAARAEGGDGGEHGDQDDDHSGDEGGPGGRGEAEADRLKLVAQGEAEADDGAGGEGAAIHAAEMATVEEGQAGEGEGHADEIEEERGDAGECVLDDYKGRTPDGNHGHQQDVSAQGVGLRRQDCGAGHWGRGYKLQGTGYSDQVTAIRVRRSAFSENTKAKGVPASTSWGVSRINRVGSASVLKSCRQCICEERAGAMPENGGSMLRSGY
jgi:hypothetical protein